MDYYLSKYIGTYRVKAEIDLNTNDFCRDRHGQLCNNNDIYIKCANGTKIYHYGSNVLLVYIPSIGAGRNIIKNIYRQYINEGNAILVATSIIRDDKEIQRTSVNILNMEVYENDLLTLTDKDIIFDIEDSDSELFFKIKDKNLSKLIELLRPQTSGCDISPFSPKNLIKTKYTFSADEIQEYKEITNSILKEDKLLIGRWNNAFLNDFICKKLGLKRENAIVEIKKLGLNRKEYFHKKGYWKQYLNYLRKEINNGYKE